MVVDSHVHAWGPPSDVHPWTNEKLIETMDEYAVDIVYTSEKLLADMEVCGIDEAVVVGHAVGDFDDNWYVTDAVGRHERLHGVALVDPLQKNAATTLRGLMDVDGMLGVRLGVNSPHDTLWHDFDSGATWLRDAVDERAFFCAARETGAVVHLLADVDQLALVEELVATYPQISFVVDHLMRPDPASSPTEPPFSRVLELSEYENVGMKVSAVPLLSTREFPYDDVHDHVRDVVSTFGRERTMWGSDFPNSSIAGSYCESFAWLDHVDALSRGDRRWLRGRAFERFVRS